LKFLNLKGSMFLTLLLETSHLYMAIDEASSLISWKYSFHAYMMSVCSNPNWPTTPLHFMNCLCYTKRCRGFVGSSLAHKSMPYSLFQKVLWALAHLIWLVVKERKYWNWISPMKGLGLLSKSSSKKKLCMCNSHKRCRTYSLCSLKHLKKSRAVLISTNFPDLTSLTFKNRYLSSRNSA